MSDDKFTGFHAYELWCAAKAHFLTDKYDAPTYRWKMGNLSVDNFILRRDRFTFERMASEYNEREFQRAVSFYLYKNPKAQIRGMIRPNKEIDEFLKNEFTWGPEYASFIRGSKEGEHVSNRFVRFVAEGKIKPFAAAILYDLYQSQLADAVGKSKLPTLKRLPKFSRLIGYDRVAASAIMKNATKNDVTDN